MGHMSFPTSTLACKIVSLYMIMSLMWMHNTYSYTCVCFYDDTCVCSWANVFAYLWKPELNFKCHSSEIWIFAPGSRILTGTRVILIWGGSLVWVRVICIYHHSTGMTNMCHYTVLSMHDGIDMVHFAYGENTLPPELSPKHVFHFLKFLRT